jgi:hypothetical protein
LPVRARFQLLPRCRASTGTDQMPQQIDFPLPSDLPRPVDDGGAAHLVGMTLPRLKLPSTAGGSVDLSKLIASRTVIYCYPMTGVPGRSLPDGWDAIPGARGCTPQGCNFQDRYPELLQLGTADLRLEYTNEGVPGRDG